VTGDIECRARVQVPPFSMTVGRQDRSRKPGCESSGLHNGATPGGKLLLVADTGKDWVRGAAAGAAMPMVGQLHGSRRVTPCVLHSGSQPRRFDSGFHADLKSLEGI
jgi:hypothetical protein